MKDKIIKISFDISYKKSDFEKGLEKVIKHAGTTLSEPKFYSETELGDMTHTARVAKIDKDLKISYRRVLDVYDVVNYGQRKGTDEWIFMDYKKFNNGYAFELDCNDKLLRSFDSVGGFLMAALVPFYEGLLDDKHTLDEEQLCIVPEITKNQFLDELGKILGEYSRRKK